MSSFLLWVTEVPSHWGPQIRAEHASELGKELLTLRVRKLAYIFH